MCNNDLDDLNTNSTESYEFGENTDTNSTESINKGLDS